MKKFKCTISSWDELKGTKKIKKQRTYQSKSFLFEAVNFTAALLLAEKIAKKKMVFTSITLREI